MNLPGISEPAPTASTSTQLPSPDSDGPCGIPIPVNPDVRRPTVSSTVTMWRSPPIDIYVESTRAQRLNEADCCIMHDVIGKVLYLRFQGSTVSGGKKYDHTERVRPGLEFTRKRHLGMTTWLKQPPSEYFTFRLHGLL